MESWVWWLIWTFLGLLAIGTWLIILLGYRKAASSLAESAAKLVTLSEQLNTAASELPSKEHPRDNLKDDPAQLIAARTELLKGRAKRKEDRARRLVARVKDIKVEGRFKDVR